MLDYKVVGAVEVTQVRKVDKFPIPVRLVYRDQDQHGVEVRNPRMDNWLRFYPCAGLQRYDVSI